LGQINHLRLPIGGRQEIIAAWVRFPRLTVEPARQSYERLSEGWYRYASFRQWLSTIVEVDADACRPTITGILRRVAEGPKEPAEFRSSGIV
jgi:hypothetical protein